MEYHELGIFFNLKGMSREKYVAEAWEVFMRCCKPEMLKNSHLFHGEGAGLLPGSGQMFCIAVRTADLKTIQYLKEVFGTCEDKRLASPIDRVRESNIVSRNRLKYRGKVDSKGRLETQEWSGIDHHLCMETEWPYCPHTRPAYLSEEQIRQLDWMSKGIKVGKDPEEKRSALRPKRTKDRRRDFKLPLILKRVVWGAIITSIIALSGIAWVNREKLLEDYRKKREEWKIRSRLSPEGYEKHQQGLAIVNISQIPPELPLKELNERFAEKGYYVLRCGEESLLDASMDCSIWFSQNRAGTDMITQGFISISMRDRNGTPLWTELAEGTIRLREGGVHVEDCRQQSMLAAINNLNLSDLLDGRAVRHYQEQGESVPSRAELVSRRVRETEKKKLQAEILQCMSKQWIMSQRLHLTSGSTRDVIVLEHKQGEVWVRTPTGKMRIPARRIAKIKAFDKKLFSEQIRKALSSLRKDFTDEWQHQTCNELIDELSSRFVMYGPAYPEACVVRLEPRDGTDELRAVVKTEKGEITVKKGGRIAGFKVIGMDPETNSLLLRMGEGGEVLRVWPRAAPQAG